jgi:hypothetical protein
MFDAVGPRPTGWRDIPTLNHTRSRWHDRWKQQPTERLKEKQKNRSRYLCALLIKEAI